MQQEGQSRRKAATQSYESKAFATTVKLQSSCKGGVAAFLYYTEAKLGRCGPVAYLKLGDLLVHAGVINESQLRHALQEQKRSGARLGDHLIDSGVITEDQLIAALRLQLGVDFIDLTQQNLPVELAAYVPKAIAQEHCVVPVRLEKDQLYIAMCDPLDFMAQESIKAVSHKEVVPMISTRAATEKAIATLYGSEGAARAIAEMKREVGGGGAEADWRTGRIVCDDVVDAAPTVRFVNSVLSRAVMERASDIHLEPQENEMVVRMRIDGLLRRILTVPTSLQDTVVSRLKVMGGMDISERKIPQDGHAMVVVKEHDIDLRLSSMPTIYGEKLVIRLLDKTAQSFSRAALGISGNDLKKYEALLKNVNGVILLVGPTGSGKSTTLCTMLRELANEEVNIMTLEDPVEYDIPGTNQCQINEKTGMTFASGLRAILRQDPDIVSVGEIRDGETASIAIRAAITGRLVFSTLHTNDAVSAITRLADIGVQPFMIAGALRGVISQRLMRRLCPHCRESYAPDAQERAFFGLPADDSTRFFRSPGCAHCSHTGYIGRRAVFEILVVSAQLAAMISRSAPADEIARAAAEQGFVEMRSGCLDLVRSGETSAAEAMRVIHTTVG